MSDFFTLAPDELQSSLFSLSTAAPARSNTACAESMSTIEPTDNKDGTSIQSGREEWVASLTKNVSK
jgi:hypothetical protein